MPYISSSEQKLFKDLDTFGLKSDIEIKGKVLIKINLARVYWQNHPRTDISILKQLITYIYQNGGTCAIAEGANGYLQKNLYTSGLEELLKLHKVKIIDADIEDYDEVVSNGERHYIPKIFKEYPVRIAMPSASKRVGMHYSNNIKLFVGAVPRKMYQLDDGEVIGHAPRARLHQNLDQSIANLFMAMKEYSPFHYYVNGGLSYNENIGEFNFDEILIGNDALKLDLHVFQKYFSDCVCPDYLGIVAAKEK